MAFSKVLTLLALCVLPALLVEADRPQVYPYHIKGRVFCDTCHLGCEHELVTYVQGAEVKIECYCDQSDDLTYSGSGSTGKDGRYVIEVTDDHKDDRCFAVLVSSPDAKCNTIVDGQDRVTAVVTNENGVVSHERYANSLGFRKDTKIEGCPKLVDLYNSDV